jgi:hypothetical protein
MVRWPPPVLRFDSYNDHQSTYAPGLRPEGRYNEELSRQPKLNDSEPYVRMKRVYVG